MSVFRNVYNGKKVFITGHTGFKGAWLTQWLLDLGAEVAGYSVDIPTNPSLFEDLSLSKEIDHHIGDVRNIEELSSKIENFDPDFLFHLAAQALVRDSYDDPVGTFATNAIGTANVLNSIRNCGKLKAAVFVTTDKVYENFEWPYGYRENDRIGGNDPYSASKGAAEIIFHSFYRSFFNSDSCPKIASARAGNVIGGGDWAKDRIIPDAVRAWKNGESLVIRNPKSTRPWQHVLEPIGAYLWLAAEMTHRKEINGEAFNFGPPPEVNQSVEALLSSMMEKWPGSKWVVEDQCAENKHEAGQLKLNCDKAHGQLGWYPCLSFEDTLEFTSEWYQKVGSDNNLAKEITKNQIESYTKIARREKIHWAMV